MPSNRLSAALADAAIKAHEDLTRFDSRGASGCPPPNRKHGKMISYEEARDSVQRRLDAAASTRYRDNVPRVVYERPTREEDFGWVFFALTKPAADLAGAGVPFEEIPFKYHLIGNAPFFVDHRYGSIHQTATARPIEFYIVEYRS
jgi:hypothetical protein